MVDKGPWRQVLDGCYRVFGDVQGVDRVNAGPDKRVLDLIQYPDDFFGKRINVIFDSQFNACFFSQRYRLFQLINNPFKLLHDGGMKFAGRHRLGAA